MQQKLVDQTQIPKSVRNWNIKSILLPSFCAFLRKEESEHECIGYLIPGSQLSEKNCLQFLNDSFYCVLLNLNI